MKTHQPNLMLGNKVAGSILKGLKGIALMACVFTYTGSFAQDNLALTVPVNLNTVQGKTIDITLKVSNRDLNNYAPTAFNLNVDGTIYNTPVVSYLIKGDQGIITIDISDMFSTTNGVDDKEEIKPIIPVGGRTSISGHLKEITIDNVSGVMYDDNHGVASIQIIDVKAITSTSDGTGAGSSLSVRPTDINKPKNDNGSNNGGSRSDDIITKDEVQGFIKTYPNPARGSFKISTTHNKLNLQEVTIISAIGSKIATIHPSENDAQILQIDTNNIPAGIYFIAIKTNMGEAVKRIVLVD